MFSPTDPLRDLLETVILEPLAFVASVPERLAKGKAKIESQKKTANMIGRFVVPMAKRKIDAELKSVAETVRSYLTNTEAKSGSRSRLSDRSDTDAPSSNGAPSSGGASSSTRAAGASADRTPGPPKVVKAKVGKPEVAKPKAKASTKPAKATPAKATPAKTAKAKATPAKTTPAKTAKVKAVAPLMATVNDLGLDSYDDLPASSVVGLLEALTPAQLQAIATYEAAHRNRQTILGGVARLLDTAP